jgi:hypothetical protein
MHLTASRRHQRTGRLAAGTSLLCALLLACALSFGPRAAAGATLLPNLVADPPDSQSIATDTSTGTPRLLLRFNGYIHNKGPGPVDFRGSREAPKVSVKTTEEVEHAREKEESLPQKTEEELASPPMKTFQRLFTTSVEETNIERAHVDEPSSGELIYASADGHHHWHLQHVAKYSLWNSAKTAEVAPAQKVGFCLDDSQHVETSIGPSSPVYADNVAPFRDFCQQYRPNATSLFEGISVGWRDLYSASLAFQWVDISNVQPGEYWLREDVNQAGIVTETGGENVPVYSTASTVVPGFDALPQATETPAGLSKTVTLTSQAFKDTAKPVYKIVSGPAHGSLSAVSEGHVTYTPTVGYSGPDSFTFSASDASSKFPEHPAAATVSIEVTSSTQPAVSIEGAPVSVTVGSSVQLSAHVVNDLPEVTWSVSGGSISSAGKFTAPAEVPAGGSVTVTATTSKGAKASKAIEITPVGGTKGLVAGDATATYSVGDQTSAGREEAFQFTAKSSGTVEELLFRTNATANTGLTGLVLGVFSESAGKPGEVLGRGTASGTPAVSSWVKVSGLSVAVTAGTRYWLVALPVGSGKLHFNAAVSSGGTGNVESVASGLSNATAESSWETYNQGPVGFQANGTTAAVPALARVARVARTGAPVAAKPGRIAIAGLPSEVTAGTSIQLTALTDGGGGPVSWSAGAGKIRSNGLFKAPLARRPRRIAIRASAPHARPQRLFVTVVPAPAVRAAPAATDPAKAVSTVEGRGLGALSAIIFNRQLVATTSAGSAGIVTIVAHAGGRLLGSCSTPTAGGVGDTCRLSLRGAPRDAEIAVTARLLVGHRVIGSRHVSGVALPTMRMAALLPGLKGGKSALAYMCSPALRIGGPGAID